MPDVIASSLSALPLHDLISGPLTAVIDAQAAAAMSSVMFIKSVGFDQQGKANTIDFKYAQTGEGGATEASVSVPLLTILNVPFIRVQDLNLDFEFKIHQVETKDLETSVGVDHTASAQGGFKFIKAKSELKASFSRKDNEKSSLERSATLRLQLRAVQDEMPAGLSEVLDILKSAIKPAEPKRALPKKASTEIKQLSHAAEPAIQRAEKTGRRRVRRA